MEPTLPTEITLKLSPEIAQFIAYSINAVIFHGVNITICTLTNWVPSKITRR
jgi:hypothetical protein